MSDLNKALDAATQQQRNAANPSYTRMASANAGSGKTRVLVDRVSRILLRGVEPSDILCLTYTKAAAAEMQERLFTKLGGWSIASEAELAKDLEALFGQALADVTPPIDLKLARQLFAKALETPEGLKVQTIHAFCERILSRFPIEAGILPGFEPLDDVQMSRLRDDVRRQILVEAMNDAGGELSRAIAGISLAKADQSLDGLFVWMAGAGEKIRAWEASGGCGPLATILGIEDGAIDLTTLKAEAWRAAPHEALRDAAKGMCASEKPKDQTKGKRLTDALNSKDPVAAFEFYASLVFKDDLTVTSQVCTGKSGPDAIAVFDKWNKTDTDEMRRMNAVGQEILGLVCYQLTEAVYTISLRYAALYKDAKHNARGLDYNDQILFVRDLLSNSAVADWVRYKLDGGIEHILVDEAQDTSPQQWAIIDALAAPFFQPSPDDARPAPRTLFAVGDEKQSIYGFQGAVPEMFLEKIREYLPADGMGEVRMRMSFRSTQQVLDVVDFVLNEGGALQDMFDAQAFPSSSDIITHPAWRQDVGAVELWPIALRPEKLEENEAWDTTPVDAHSEANQREVLAKKIAVQIQSWIDGAAPISDKDGTLRPIHAGDVLILVRSRGPFFEAVIRQLKKHNIPVAGADRLTLQDSIVVKDMLALTRFVLLPSDDLSLAEVLKSPFFGFDDTQLFDIAVDRENSLWASLQMRAPETADSLQQLIHLSKAHMPYDFYAQFLERDSGDGRVFRERIYARLSLEAQDALEAFLACALDHHLNNVPSLQRFLQSFESHEVQIKREMDNAAREVRVMTVHGAKGLEAPIVILPDTTQVPAVKAALIPVKAGFAWKPSKEKVPAALESYAEALSDKQLQEQLRLLYVAMTRAESRLIICGFDNGQNKDGIKEGSWYARLANSFAMLETTPFHTPFDNGEVTGQRFGALPSASQPMEIEARVNTETAKRPAWIDAKITQENAPRRYVTPSHLLAKNTAEPAMRSPRRARHKSQFLRGNIIHKLLEVLPEFQTERRRDIAQTLVRGYPELKDGQGQMIIDEVFAVLENPEFTEIFAAGSRAEISLAGSAKTLPEGLYLNAQIDRICVSASKVFIVDYKSNRPSPKRVEDISEIYLGQMAAYRELAREIYPKRTIICALLWTDVPHLTPLPDSVMDEALQKLHGLPKS